MRRLESSTGFEWDAGNLEKNWERHAVSRIECEEPFFNQPFVVLPDELHSLGEDRLLALGHTDAGRLLLLVFTLRGDRIRVISARDMTRKERRIYEHAKRQEAEADSAL